MTKEEKADLDELYEYVRTEIMGYDSNQSLSKKMFLRLKGLTTGRYIDNNKVKQMASYSYKTIYLTFKVCTPAIKKVLAQKTFDNEYQKFAYICAIVENKINDVYIAMKKREKSENKVNEMKTDNLTYTGSTYKKKTIRKQDDKFDELW